MRERAPNEQTNPVGFYVRAAARNWEKFEKAQARVVELEAENALLKRALAMLTRSLEDAEAESEHA